MPGMMPRMASRATLNLHDAVHDGALIPALRDWRAEGDSFSTCARRLHDEFDVIVDATTVRRWLLTIEERVTT